MFYDNQKREWYLYQGILIARVAPHEEIVLSKEEEKRLLKESGALLLRYTDRWDNEKSEFWYIVKDAKEDLNSYKSKVRNQIKKGLKNCKVKKISSLEITNNGYIVYLEAMKNYDTDLKPVSQAKFKKSSDGYDFWGVYEIESGTMIAYSSNKIMENVCNYTEMKFHPSYLKFYPSYALFYEMNSYYLKNKDFFYVHDGARSISHSTNIHSFLIQKFKFRKAYCRLNIVYRWDVGLVVKILYLFKNIIFRLNYKLFKKISVILKQEEIRRSFE